MRLLKLSLQSFLISSVILFASASASGQSSALTLPRNIATLTGESQIVVQGWVASVSLEPHEQLKNLMTVVITLQVEETLKGAPVKTLTFRQAVLDRKDLQQEMGYRTGQHLLLALIKPSHYGLSSPAGMEQGRFRIEFLPSGELSATNGFRNAGLFRGLDSQLKSRGIRVVPEVQEMILKPETGPVSLKNLKSLIRTLASTDSTK